MDEQSPQSLQENADVVATEGNGSLKAGTGEEEKVQVHQKSGGEKLSSGTVFDTNIVNTNGIDSDIMNAESLEDGESNNESEHIISNLETPLQSTESIGDGESITANDNSNDRLSLGEVNQANSADEGTNNIISSESEQLAHSEHYDDNKDEIMTTSSKLQSSVENNDPSSVTGNDNDQLKSLSEGLHPQIPDKETLDLPESCTGVEGQDIKSPVNANEETEVAKEYESETDTNEAEVSANMNSVIQDEGMEISGNVTEKNPLSEKDEEREENNENIIESENESNKNLSERLESELHSPKSSKGDRSDDRIEDILNENENMNLEEHKETELEFHFEGEVHDLRNEEKQEDTLALDSENPIDNEMLSESECVQKPTTPISIDASDSESCKNQNEDSHKKDSAACDTENVSTDLNQVDVFHMDLDDNEHQRELRENEDVESVDKGENEDEEMEIDKDVDILATNSEKDSSEKDIEMEEKEEKEDRDGSSKDIDDKSHSNEESGEKEEMEKKEDKAETNAETQKEAITDQDDEVLELPGNSEEETITGDTSRQVPAELTEGIGKDAEVCIIPDDMTPRLSISSSTEISKAGEKTQNKPDKSDEVTKNKKEKSEPRIIRVATLAPEKRKSKSTDGKGAETEDSSKGRPVRNAAKLAGNKIKSLVQSDLASEEPVDDPAEVLAEESSDDTEEADETEDVTEPPTRMCAHCKRVKACKFEVEQAGHRQHLCCDACYNAFLKGVTSSEVEVSDADGPPAIFLRKCGACHQPITGDEKCLSWETMDFCNEDCLGKYQTELGSACANCRGSVASASLGKYCVRFGYDVKQFCTSSCLEEYKKGLKVCSYCQKDISSGMEGFLAPVGDKGQFKDFCTQSCMEKYEQMSSNTPPPEVTAECAVCSNSKPVRVEVELDNKTQKLCSEPCFAAFKFVNNITEGQCDMCRKYFDRLKTANLVIFYEDAFHSFCCKTCMNVYILANRKIVPCNWCKVKKYNFDMIKKVLVTGQVLMMCSLNCLMLYQVSVNAVSSRRIKCDFCQNVSQAQYHLTMSDATIRNFCSYSCVMSFQNQYPKQPLPMPGTDQLSSPIPTGGPKRVVPRRAVVETSCVPVISSVQSLASPNGPVAPPSTRVTLPVQGSEVNIVNQVTPIAQPITIQSAVTSMPAPPQPQVYQQIITKPPPAKEMKNKSVLCKPYTHTKGVSCRPHPCMKETQTDESLNLKCLIPIPVPIYVPAPMHMYSSPFPVIVPFPLPVPVPIFIPTTRNSAKGIFKEIKKIQEKIPTDPFEAELLMMAEMVAGEKKQDPTDSESDGEGNEPDDAPETFSPENVDTSNTFGDDMLQMALKMASELEEPAVDMESVLTSNTITPSSQPTVDPSKALYVQDPDDPDQVPVMSMNRGRKRAMRGARHSPGSNQSKRGRRTSSSVDVPMMPPPEPVPPPRIEVEKPDANMCLKYTFGVNAWRHWVMQKNAELEKAAMTNRKIKLFKPELLQLTADELNFSLCLFVKEVRKPNGTEYAPDTIYYLCLGIQQYLFENGRIDNIFTDSYYEKFTDCLDEVAKKFAALYNDSQYIVTRVEEEHLWESKQLGAHSPHVLLSTLMFFNTKHFNLVTVEEHMQLSFSHIMKHWKRNPNAPGVAKVPGSRNVLLRFYPPQSALEANSRKKKVYEQQENEENPLRCPVKLYEFYLSKCPESVKTRNDVFYLLPERSCVPDSPVWYSTMALGKEPLMKMLHRVKMVKEINIALLTC